eukprot:7136977-Pyramimonas_sp.AAC.4
MAGSLADAGASRAWASARCWTQTSPAGSGGASPAARLRNRNDCSRAAGMVGAAPPSSKSMTYLTRSSTVASWSWKLPWSTPGRSSEAQSRNFSMFATWMRSVRADQRRKTRSWWRGPRSGPRRSESFQVLPPTVRRTRSQRGRTRCSRCLRLSVKRRTSGLRQEPTRRGCPGPRPWLGAGRGRLLGAAEEAGRRLRRAVPVSGRAGWWGTKPGGGAAWAAAGRAPWVGGGA